MNETHASGGCCGDEGPYFYDEHGYLIEDAGQVTDGGRALPLPPFDPPVFRPPVVIGPPVIERPPINLIPACGLPILNGSWLVEFTSKAASPFVLLRQIRGPMRIEVRENVLRISGDIYVRQLADLINIPTRLTPILHGDEPGQDGPIINPLPPIWQLPEQAVHFLGVNGAPIRPTYPQLPMNQYSWYFRSTGVTYAGGTLNFTLARHLWDRTTQEFVSQDTGSMSLTCRRNVLTKPGTPAVMTGTANIGGQAYSVKATKTSNHYRGCAVEVDVMTGRDWPASALNDGVTRTFRNVYASSGWDVSVDLDELDVPSDNELTMAELETLMTNHRSTGEPNDWRLWLLVGSRSGTLLGIMFDDDSVPREGAVGFADARLSNASYIEESARGQQLNDVPAAFLRTMIHEAGHAFNLYHPKHDVHGPPIGTEIMNQTGDVMGFASSSDPYPGNATFAFAAHDHDSLVHSPDPQVRPGWKNFGWGHGSLSSGLAVPTDAAGLQVGDDAEGLSLTLAMPSEVFVGEFVTAAVTLTNTGDEARDVTGRLNLAEGYLRFHHVLPEGTVEQVRDVVVACGLPSTTRLEPGESMSARMQVFFTNEGVTFERPGTHVVRAEFTVDMLSTARSNRVQVHVRTAATDTEVDIAINTLEPVVGRAFALGDFGNSEEARSRLVTVAEAHHEQDTGAAAALVLANSLARTHTDMRHDATRDAAPDDAQHFLDLAMKGRSAESMVFLAATVASPVEADAPVVRASLARAKKARKAKTDLEVAEQIMSDFEAAAPS